MGFRAIEIDALLRAAQVDAERRAPPAKPASLRSDNTHPAPRRQRPHAAFRAIELHADGQVQGDFVNFGSSDYTRCQVLVNGTQISAVSATVGNTDQSGSIGPAGLVVPFSLTGGINVPAAGGTAVLQCWHDSSNGATPDVDANTSMWAHRTSSVKTATE